MSDKGQVKFIRVNGRIVPIRGGKSQSNKSKAVATGSLAGAAALAYDGSRTKVGKAGSHGVMLRKDFFKPKQSTLVVFNKDGKGAMAKFKTSKRSIDIGTVYSNDKRSAGIALREIHNTASAKGHKTIKGSLLSSHAVIDLLKKRDTTFHSLSKKGLKEISATSAKGSITKFKGGKARSVVSSTTLVKPGLKATALKLTRGGKVKMGAAAILSVGGAISLSRGE